MVECLVWSTKSVPVGAFHCTAHLFLSLPSQSGSQVTVALCSQLDAEIQLRQNEHAQDLERKPCETAQTPVLTLLATVNQLPAL